MIGRKLEISEEGRLNWKKRSANPEYRRRLSIGMSRAIKNGTMIMPLGFRDEEIQRKAQESLKLSRKNGSYPEKIVYNFLLPFFSEDDIKRGFEVQGPKQKVGNQTGIVGERHRQYFLDIALLNKKVDIEIDGEIYHLNKERDSLRDSFLEENGWKVIRVPAKWVSNNEYKKILKDELNL